jgi:hypothetical protein
MYNRLQILPEEQQKGIKTHVIGKVITMSGDAAVLALLN